MLRVAGRQMGQLVAVLFLALAAAACGSSGEVASAGGEGPAAESPNADGAVNEGAVEESGGDEGTINGDPWEDYTSPIQEFLGVDFSSFDDEDFEAEFAEQQRAAEESIAVCMRELGGNMFQSTKVSSSVASMALVPTAWSMEAQSGWPSTVSE